MADQEGAEPMVEQDNGENKPEKNSTTFRGRIIKLKPRKIGKRVKKVKIKSIF